LRAVGEVACHSSLNTPLVDPHAVGLAGHVGDPCIEIAIAIEVTESDTVAIGVAEGLAAVEEVACHSSLITALVDPHAVGQPAVVCDPSIEIAIAIKVTEGDIFASGVSKGLTTVCEVDRSSSLITPLVDPHTVGFVLVRDPSIEITIAIEITEGDTVAIEDIVAIGVAEGII
jgi:hypothetical protein